MTSRQAKEAYRRSGGTPRISEIERRRIDRACELRDRALMIQKKERCRKIIRERIAVRAREERERKARLGLPQVSLPTTKSSQRSLGGWFRPRAKSLQETAAGDKRISGTKDQPIVVGDSSTEFGSDTDGDTKREYNHTIDLNPSVCKTDPATATDDPAIGQLVENDRESRGPSQMTGDCSIGLAPGAGPILPSLSWAFENTMGDSTPRYTQGDVIKHLPAGDIDSEIVFKSPLHMPILRPTPQDRLLASSPTPCSPRSPSYPQSSDAYIAALSPVESPVLRSRLQSVDGSERGLDWGETVIGDSELLLEIGLPAENTVQSANANRGSPIDAARQEDPEDVLATISTQDLVLSSQ